MIIGSQLKNAQIECVADETAAIALADKVVGRVVYNIETDRLLVYNVAGVWKETGYDLAAITVAGATILNGDTDIGGADTDTVTITAKVDSNVIPTGTRNLGESGAEWNEIHGDTVTATTVDASGDVSGATVTLNHTTTPTEAAGTVKLYSKTDNKVYTIDADGNESEVGSGSGSGGKNYIDNPGGEGASINGWLEYDEAGATIPTANPSGTTSAAANLALTAPTSDLLSGANNLLLTKGAANASGEGIYYPFTIDKADCAKKMVISFDYKTENTDYEDGFIKIFIWDGTNIVRVNGEDVKAVSGVGKHYAQFQTHATTVDCKLLIHVNEAGSDDWTLRLDNVSVSPQKISHGAIVTDWKEYTPASNVSTNTTWTGLWRRVGQNIECRVKMYCDDDPGVGGSINATLPSGLSIDEDLVESLSTFSYFDRIVGTTRYRNADDSGDSGAKNGMVSVLSSTQVYFTWTNLQAASADSPIEENSVDIDDVEPFNFEADDYLVAYFSVPIEGWSSNAKMSEDFSGRNVVVNVVGDGSTAQTINNTGGGESITLTNWTENVDTTSSFNASTGIYTIPETGYYDISGGARLGADAVDLERVMVTVRKATVGGSLSDQFSSIAGNDIADAQYYGGHISVTGVYYIKGETIALGLYQENTDQTAATATASGSDRFRYFQIAKRQSAQTILENETVAARYTKDDAQTITRGANTTVEYDDKDFDTHNAMDTVTNKGRYTVPITGYYQINVRVGFNDFETSNDTLLVCGIKVNGTVKAENATNFTGASAAEWEQHTENCSDILYMTAGQYVEGYVFYDDVGDDDTGATELTHTYAIRTTFSIHKIK